MSLNSSKGKTRKTFLCCVFVVLLGMPPEGLAKEEKSQEGPVLRELKAVGSGCRGDIEKSGGDVRFERRPTEPGSPDVYRARIFFETYRLDSADFKAEGSESKEGDSKKRGKEEKANFQRDLVRECAVRITVYPPPGKRIKTASARSNVIVSKGKGVGLVVVNELLLGATHIQKVTHEYPSSAQVSSQGEDLILEQPPLLPGQVMQPSRCGDPRILSFDYTFYAQRQSAADEVQVRIGGDKHADVSVYLEDCES